MSMRRGQFVGYLYLLPNFLLFLLILLVPLCFSFFLAFFDWGAKELASVRFDFVGLANFGSVLSLRGEFWKYLGNTLFLMLGIPITIAIQLGVALLMDRKLREITLYRTMWFLPSVATGAALLLLWLWIYQGKGGLLNNLLALIHIRGPDWLREESWAKPAFITMGWWTNAGGMGMIFYLAALQGIPQHLYEVADIDGAGPWARFRHITWPMVSPTTFFLLITGVIGGFQAGFMQVYMLTGGGPNGATTTLSFWIYQLAYREYRMGYACAVAWILFLFVAAFTAINWRYAGRRVHY
jgi:multiple sugar transport system permease protein